VFDWPTQAGRFAVACRPVRAAKNRGAAASTKVRAMCSRVVIAWISARVNAEGGQDLLEYGLLTSLIAVFLVGALTAAGNQINNVLWAAIAAAP
jgi:Flp pilus assembly pilin Flp